MKTIHVTVLEHNTPRREALQMLLNDTVGLNCSGLYKDGYSYLEILHEPTPDVVLLDINIECNNLNDVIKGIKSSCPDTKIIMQSNFESDLLSAAILAGADGYLLKKIKPDILLEAIRKINAGIPILYMAPTPHLLPNKSYAYSLKNNNGGQKIIPVLNSFT